MDTRMGTTYMYDKDANLTTPLPEKVLQQNINLIKTSYTIFVLTHLNYFDKVHDNIGLLFVSLAKLAKQITY